MNIDIQSIIQAVIPWLLTHGIKIIAILIGSALVVRFGKIFLEKMIRGFIRPDQVAKDPDAEKKREDTLIRTFNSLLTGLIWTMAILMVLGEFGINITPLLASAGLIGLAIGMGAKDLIKDYLSGLYILIEDQYKIGDLVKIAGVEGKVLDINLKRTILEDEEGTIHSVPNGQIKISSNKSKKVKI